MAAHGGIGWMKSLTDSVDLDIYAKYLWSHVSGDDDSISGSHVNFDAMDSNRLRGGARLSFKGSDTFSWYLGAAYERQFNGRSASDVYGHDTPSASLKGDTAMVEAGLGISIMPQMLLRDCKAAVKIYPIEPEEYRVVGLAVQRPAAMAPAVEQMFHHIVDYCKQVELQ